MRLVCMVPSWTEMLIERGFDVVGRTRYCIHPKDKVQSIAVVGGTKDISWDKVKALNADLLILDQEENPKRFAEQSPISWWSSHIENLQSLPRDLNSLKTLLQSKEQAQPIERLSQVIQQWEEVIQRPCQSSFSLDVFPGLIQWMRKPEDHWRPKHVLYLIWKNPWMAVSKNTFIGSVLQSLGVTLPLFETKYPKIDLSQYNPEETLVLFSSEPYPFAQHQQEIINMPFRSALVDGEKFSWFGVRSLQFLFESLPK